jgi:primosomal protein N' (replication factor Y)
MQTCPYPVHVIHSQKTPAHRKKIWQIAQKNEKPSLYIGPRSSLFLPYKNLGLVVIDEAHDNSYKSMQSPKYSGIYIAAQLAKIHSAHLVQSTATPNVSDYSALTSRNIPIARMTTIAAGVEQPAIGAVIDMTDKSQFSTHRLLSDPLLKAVSDALDKNEQSMLFLNRRGSARIVQCNSCGHIELCPTCGLPMTFHHDTHTLSCHVCATHTKATSQCSNCSSVDLLYFSPGTKGLEQEVAQLFPKARVVRFDLDVSAKDAIHKKLKELQTGEFDIIIGTQLISKGFDLPSLSVVGVLNADSGFAIPDFRAEEITFQQLYQVTGRVGRGHTLSKFFIQTRQPHHPVIEAALIRNWQNFYEYELHKRKQFSYPPYTYLALISITKAKAITAQKAAEAMALELARNARISLLGPSPSYHETAQGGSTWQILVKSASRSALVKALEDVPNEWSIDVDPTSVL